MTRKNEKRRQNGTKAQPMICQFRYQSEFRRGHPALHAMRESDRRCNVRGPSHRPSTRRRRHQLAVATSSRTIGEALAQHVKAHGKVALPRRECRNVRLRFPMALDLCRTTEGFYDTRPQRSGRCKCHGYHTKGSRREQKSRVCRRLNRRKMLPKESTFMAERFSK